VTKRLPLVALAAALILAGICYSAAVGSDFQLDDQGNLGNLNTVSDRASAIDFILAGTAGPTGRPLSLLTFALQAEQWQQGPDAFLHVNIFIHLLNALLLAFLVRQLFVVRGDGRRQATLIGCVAASIWVTLPLIATATMLVVQRMTTLSAFFMLAGLVAYLSARTMIDRSPRKALSLMAVSLTGASVLAVLAKESGLLLPLYVLVIESTLLQRPEHVSQAIWRNWTAVFLWLPALIVIAYLFSVFDYPDYMIQFRGFDAAERLLTEAQLLWVYLSKALVGISGRLGIYQGNVEVVRSLWTPAALLAVTGWLVLTLGAVVWRRRYPLFAMAVLWYLSGHLLESTVVPLELYFEHRNYLPIVGPIIALTAFLILHSGKVRTVALRLIPLIVLVNAGFLYSFASLQGEPRVAARYWAVKYPDSIRAVTNLLNYQLAEESTEQVIETIRDFSSRNPDYGTLRIQELYYMCKTRPEELQPAMVEEVRTQLADTVLSFTAIPMLLELFSTANKGQCPAVSTGTVMKMAEELRDNPKYATNPRYNMNHHMLLATMHQQLGDNDAAAKQLRDAYDALPSESVVLMMTVTLAPSGDFAAAREFLDEAARDKPVNPIKAMRWQRLINRLYDYVDSAEIEISESR
jgi:tetratricopeptide (TPR) repeat protein